MGELHLYERLELAVAGCFNVWSQHDRMRATQAVELSVVCRLSPNGCVAHDSRRTHSRERRRGRMGWGRRKRRVRGQAQYVLRAPCTGALNKGNCFRTRPTMTCILDWARHLRASSLCARTSSAPMSKLLFGQSIVNAFSLNEKVTSELKP